MGWLVWMMLPGLLVQLLIGTKRWLYGNCIIRRVQEGAGFGSRLRERNFDQDEGERHGARRDVHLKFRMFVEERGL